MIICRVCLDSNDTLIPLVSDKHDAWPVVYMLDEFTIINAENQLPKYICEMCTAHLDAAHAFKRKYEDSIVRFIRQTSCQEETNSTMTCGSSSSTIGEKCSPNEDQLYSKPHDVIKILPKVISLDNLPSNGIWNSDDNSNGKHHSLAGYSDDWNENDVNLIQNDSNIVPVHGVSANHDTVQVPSQDISNECQRSNLLPDVFNNEVRSDVLSQCDINHERESNLSPGSVYNNQGSDGHLSHFNINQHGINNENQESNILPDEFNNQNTDNGMLGLVNTILCYTEPAERHKQGESMQYLNLTRSQMKPSALSKIYHYGYGMKPFRCDVCSRWFKTKGHIKAHLFRHYVGKKRIKCRKCSLTFLTKRHFRTHRCLARLFELKVET